MEGRAVSGLGQPLVSVFDTSPLHHPRHPPDRHGIAHRQRLTLRDRLRDLGMPQRPLRLPQHVQHHPRQLAPPEPVAALAAGLLGPDRLGVGVRAHDADRGVEVHQVGPELRERGVERVDLAGQLGALADQGGGGRFRQSSLRAISAGEAGACGPGRAVGGR